MNGLPKGLRLEASVNVNVVSRISLIATSAEPRNIRRGETLRIEYEIECYEAVEDGIWLGASFRDATNKLFCNTSQDKAVSLAKGKHTYHRNLTVAKDAPLGEQKLNTNVWKGVVGESSKSKWIAGAAPIPIKVMD